MERKRQRLNLRIDTQTYEAIVIMTRAGGYRSPCETARCILRAAAFTRLGADEGRDQDSDAAREIAAIFDGLSNHQRQPDGTVPVRIHSKSLNDYEP